MPLTHDRRIRIAALTNLLYEAGNLAFFIVFMPTSTGFGFIMFSGFGLRGPRSGDAPKFSHLSAVQQATSVPI
jgi:hypothetical protein